MGTDTSIILSHSNRVRLELIVRNRVSAQQHVWRARIVLLTADGLGGVPRLKWSTHWDRTIPF